MTSRSTWLPPEEPDPRAIFRDAKLDAAKGCWADALAKHLWFHEHALEIEPSLSGVRLSYALSAWLNLAQLYPPAMTALRNAREMAEAVVHDAKGEDDSDAKRYHAFHDFVNLNEALRETDRTVELYKWLDGHEPELARLTLNLAQRALLPAQEFALCGKYLHPEEDFQRMTKAFRYHLEMSKKEEFSDMKDFGEQTFASKVGTLIALLAINDRTREAQEIYERAIEEWKDTEFHEWLGKAMRGEVPKQYPPRD